MPETRIALTSTSPRKNAIDRLGVLQVLLRAGAFGVRLGVLGLLGEDGLEDMAGGGVDPFWGSILLFLFGVDQQSLPVNCWSNPQKDNSRG